MTRVPRDVVAPLRTELDVPPDLAALQPVRDVLADAVGLWRTPVECDRLLLLTTEVLTNAVDHGRPPISVSMEWDGVHLHVAVCDADDAVPVLQDPEPDDPGGRGVWLVAHLASSWGIDLHDEGKAVWFELDAPASLLTGDGEGAARPAPSCRMRR